ncbi:MAG TPA: PilZ domain-containing protein [Sphingomicrobium sp.]|jgi:hypothetical protein|nr:PilZ domain-containing protein [Sphingomicrobium sp.]
MNIRAKIFGGKTEDETLIPAKQPKGARADTLDSISVRRAEGRRGDTRGGDRHRLPDEQVRVSHDGRTCDVQLINLSGGGAMVEGDFEPKLWDRVDLHLGENGTIECAVRWIKGGRIGLEFAHETTIDCSTADRARVLRAVVAKTFPDVELEAAALDVEEATPVGAENRTDRRHPLIWSGTLHHDFQSTPCRLRNISATGAMIECQALVRVGAEPMLELSPEIQLSATVAWAVGDTAGLSFSQPFDLTLLAGARPDVASGWKAPAYLQRGVPDTDTPWDHMSLGELRQSLEGFMKR